MKNPRNEVDPLEDTAMTKISDTSLSILRIIADSPEPIKSDLIRQSQALRGEDAKRISNALFNLKEGEYAVADAARCYSITARGRAVLADNGHGVAIKTKPGSGAGKRTKGKPDLTTKGVIEHQLQNLAIKAQEAIDSYIQSIGGDKNVYTSLIRVRDEAVGALSAYQKPAR